MTTPFWGSLADDVLHTRGTDPKLWVEANDEFVWAKQAEILDSVVANRYTAVHSAHDLGKLLRLDEPIPTPSGWTTMGEVGVGDLVLDEQGRPTPVSWKSPVQTEDCYRLVFDDGTSIEAGARHQWQVLDLTKRKRHGPRINDWREEWDSSDTLTTEELFTSGTRTVHGQRRWRVPVTKSLDLPEQTLPLDPYVLGLWLADGSRGTSNITLNKTTKASVAKELARRWVAGTHPVPSAEHDDIDKRTWAVHGLLTRLRLLGVHRDKHIPPQYLRASSHQRLDLLRGFMDGDGFRLGDTHAVGVDTTDEVMADDIEELALTLGFKVRRSEGAAAYTKNGRRVVTGVRYRLNWRPDVDCFLARDPRLVAPAAQRSAHTQRTIASIEPCEPSPMACISVESVRHVYLAGRSFLPTHNSFIASRIIAWWIDSHPIGEAFVVSTAPSAAQVSAIMWREVAKIHRKAELEGKVNRAGYPQWYIGAELVGYGRKPADYEQSAFQGIHAKYVLVVIDEACGVPRHLYDAIDSLVTNQNCRVLAIGNPDDASSHFASICKPGSGWNTIHLDGLRSPNITYDRVIGDDPEFPKYPLLAALMEAEHIPYSTEVVPDELREYLIDERWIEERIHRWAGVAPEQLASLSEEQAIDMLLSRTHGSSLFTAKVRGIFPDAASEGVIPLGWITQAVARWHDIKDRLGQTTPGGYRCTGVDVARTGVDQTCFAHRHGDYVSTVEKMRITDTMEVANRAAAFLHEPGSTAVIDVIGIGSGVYDRLRQMKNRAEIIGTAFPFNASKQAQRRDRLGQFHFFNDRAAAWWNLREKLDPAFGSQLAIPDDEELIEELCAPKFDLYANGRLKIESKDQIKARIGRSTDSADALIQAFWIDGNAGAGEALEYADAGAYVGRETRGSVYNYDGYSPFTDEDMSETMGAGSLSGYGTVPVREPTFKRFGDPHESGW